MTTPAPPSLAEMRETLETIGKTLMAPDTAYAVAAANFALDRLSQTEANATAWHGAVDTICTVLGIEGALGASEAIEAVRDHDGALRGRVRQAEAAYERMEQALQRIVQWSEAYPLDIFPEPDFTKAREALKAAGMTLDAISASNMRHVVEGVGKIARAALSKRDRA